MFIGHMPSVYLGITALCRRVSKPVFAAALVGSVFPDIDMLWFYFFDNRGHHHHEYLTHQPAIYIALLMVAWGMRSRIGYPLVAFSLGALVHMVLDSVVGQIAWGWPVSHHAHTMFVVEATHDHWILSFVNHWYFGIEVAITAAAAAVLVWRWRRKT